jgi:DNA polymerase I-like protein with 3'-5' exonuclease and polymerase domains
MALITEAGQLEDMVAHYLGQPEFAFDVETIGDDRKDAHSASVAWISLATEGRSDVIPMEHPHGELLSTRKTPLLSGKRKLDAGKSYEDLLESDLSKRSLDHDWGPRPKQLDRSVVFTALRPLFSSEALKIGHNIRYDLHCVSRYLGWYPEGPYYDTLIASWLLDVTRRGRLGLGDCVQRELGRELVKGVGRDISQHSFSEVAKYSLLDAEATWDVKKALDPQYAKASTNTRMLLDLEMSVLHPVLEMESTGIRIDRARLQEIDDELRADIDGLQGLAYSLAGKRFNIRSNGDKQKILFLPKKEGGLGLAPLKTTESAKDKRDEDLGVNDYSVDNETLEHHRKSPLVRALIAHSSKAKLHGTYVLPYLGGLPVRDEGEKVKIVESRLRKGRIHGQFLQFGTESGRFSSKEPNLQNIPSRSTDGKKLREIFVADPGHVLVVADWSQIEPRIIASLSGDKTMISTYNDGGDVYMAVADRMDVTRATGKELVLSIAYGIGAPTISSRIGCTVAEAEDLMDFFTQRFSAIPRHKDEVLALARMNRYSETIFGRRRPLPRIHGGDNYTRAAAERQAYNHVIQGCLPADARVLTQSGWQPIGDFVDGTEVWTGEKWSLALRFDRGIDTRLRLHLSDGRTFDCDTRHKLLVCDSVWPRWAGMDEIIGLPLVEDRVEEWGIQQDHPDDWYWLGRMIGDGHTSKPEARNRVWSLAFGPDEDEDRQRFFVWLDKNRDYFKGGSNSRTGYTTTPAQVQGQTMSGWSYWVDRGVVGGSRGKRVPDLVFRQDRSRREAFFSGYFDADGHSNDRSRKITSVNIELLRDTLRLMQTLGKHGRISGPMKNSDGVEWYDLYIHSTPTVLTVERVEELPPEQMYTLSVADDRHAFSSEGLISKNSAADIMKIALVNVHAMLPPEASLLMTVHDEVVVQAPDDMVDDVMALVRREMEGAKPRSIAVPLVADVKSGHSWAEGK